MSMCILHIIKRLHKYKICNQTDFDNLSIHKHSSGYQSIKDYLFFRIENDFFDCFTRIPMRFRFFFPNKIRFLLYLLDCFILLASLFFLFHLVRNMRKTGTCFEDIIKIIWENISKLFECSFIFFDKKWKKKALRKENP